MIRWRLAWDFFVSHPFNELVWLVAPMELEPMGAPHNFVLEVAGAGGRGRAGFLRIDALDRAARRMELGLDATQRLALFSDGSWCTSCSVWRMPTTTYRQVCRCSSGPWRLSPHEWTGCVAPAGKARAVVLSRGCRREASLRYQRLRGLDRRSPRVNVGHTLDTQFAPNHTGATGISVPTCRWSLVGSRRSVAVSCRRRARGS